MFVSECLFLLLLASLLCSFLMCFSYFFLPSFRVLVFFLGGVMLGVGSWAACGARALCVMRVCACAVRDACVRCVSARAVRVLGVRGAIGPPGDSLLRSVHGQRSLCGVVSFGNRCLEPELSGRSNIYTPTTNRKLLIRWPQLSRF